MSEIVRKGNLVIISPGQDLVNEMADKFIQELKDEIKNSPSEIIIDLSGVEKIDSVGFGVIIAVHNSMKKINGQIVVANADANLYKAFVTMRLDSHFSVGKAL
ncbi:MAG: STAS domain-containing protein [Deltaproteobacteria bacterium]|nr:STAS domain-containing protein [Deltaproteobacteria bacterium]